MLQNAMHLNRTCTGALNDLMSIISALKSVASTLAEASKNPQLFSPNFSQPYASEGEIDPNDAVSLVAELRQEFQLVEKKFKTVIARLNRIRNSSKSLVPVHRLPNELLSYVFLLGQGTFPQGNFPPDSRKRGIFYEDRVSQVCLLWRSVSIGTANLWRCIDYRQPGSHRRARRFLERSGSSELSIYLFPRFDTTDSFWTSLITPSFHRCYSLSLTPTCSEHMAEFVSWMQANSPQRSLREIRVSYELSAIASADGPLMIVMQGCSDKFSGVTDLRIDHISFPRSYTSQQNATFLQNITALHFTRVSMYNVDFRRMLRHCSRLEYLRLERCGFTRDGDHLELELPLLRHLTVVDAWLGSLGLCTYIALPSLELLTIAHHTGNHPCRNAIAFFSSTLIRSVSRTSVELTSGGPSEGAETLEYLRSIPVIGELRVHFANKTAVRNKEGVWTTPLDIFM
jgi:hypothetical protein